MYTEDIKRTVPYSKKVANNYKRQTQLMAIYNNYWFDQSDRKDRVDRITRNADLLNGYVDPDDYNSQTDLTLFGDTVPIGHFNITHYPHIAKIAEAAVGEELLMPFKISVVDLSDSSKNERSRVKEQLLKTYLNDVYVAPIAEQIMAGIDQRQIANMPPEQQQQVAVEVQKQVEAMTPKEIGEYLTYEYKSQPQIQGQKLMNLLDKKLKLKQKKNQGFEDQYAYAEVYYLVGIDYEDINFRVLNPKYVEYAPSPTSPWIQDAQYALYREQVTIQEAFALDGEYLEKADIKKLTSLVHGFENYGRAPGYSTNADDETVLFEIHKNPDLLSKYGTVDPRSSEGHNKMIKVYEEILHGGYMERGEMYLTRTYIAWRDMAFYKRVQRRNPRSGELVWEWEAENYVFNPDRGDVKIKTVEKPEVWHGVVYGYGDDAVYLKIEPFPFQHKGAHDIHNPKLPFFGGKVNTRNGNATKNVSCVDLGKEWNYAFDLQMAEMKLQQATNLGKVFVMIKEMKPEGVTWGEWMTTMKYLKVALVEGVKEDAELPPHLAQLLKGVDMGVLSDLSGSIQMLTYTQGQIAEAMYFSQERLGNINQYMTATNSQQAVNASTVQTLRLYENHLNIFQEACQYLLDVARTVYKNNPSKRAILFNDLDQADLELDWEMLQRSELGVFISLSAADLNKVREIKGNTLAIIQNQMLDIDDLFEFMESDTTGELKNLGHKITKKRQKAQAESQQMENERIQQTIQAEMQKFSAELENRKEVQILRSQGNLEAAIVDSEKYKNMMDVDADGEADRNQYEREKLAWEKEKFELEHQLKIKELEIKEMAAKNKSSNS